MANNIVSVIMPTYNTGKLLIGSINSVLNQTYSNIELLIVDDCSSDEETKRILNDFSQKDCRVNVTYLKSNHGPSYARNIAIEKATGRYIAFCDSDDRWHPAKIEKQIDLMEKKNCALCCSAYCICDINNNIVGINIPPKHITLNQMKYDNKIGCTTAIYDIKRLGKKYFMPKLYKSEDWALFLQIIKACKDCYSYTEEPLAYYYLRSESLSSNKLSMIKYNLAVYQEILDYNPIKAYTTFLLGFIPSYFKKIIRRKIDSYKYLKKHSSFTKK